MSTTTTTTTTTTTSITSSHNLPDVLLPPCQCAVCLSLPHLKSYLTWCSSGDNTQDGWRQLWCIGCVLVDYHYGRMMLVLLLLLLYYCCLIGLYHPAYRHDTTITTTTTTTTTTSSSSFPPWWCLVLSLSLSLHARGTDWSFIILSLTPPGAHQEEKGGGDNYG